MPRTRLSRRNLGPRARSMSMRAIKRAVKAVASGFGMIATFMAKPFTDLAGSGMHLHFSLLDREGRRLLEGGEARDLLLRHAIGGMAATMADGTAIFAPNANAYRRFQVQSYAPVAPTWGVNNRTVGFRVPLGPAGTRHVEHRICGADANSTLAVAALLASIHYGIQHRIDPGAPIVGDGYALAAEQGLSLPRHWNRALDAFANSGQMRDYLGARFHQMFTAIKRSEYDRYNARVTELDYEWYLRNA